MNRVFTILVSTGFILGLLQGVSLAAGTFRVHPAALAKLGFDLPPSAPEKEYLGLSGAEKFTLPRIKARVIILELFSMYCPICQAEAENVNELHRLVEHDPALKGKVKLLGIGTGNTPFEVDVFRKKFKIEFPLVPDEDFLFEKASSGKLRTPTFVVLGVDHGKALKVVGIHVGRLGDVGQYLITIRKAAKGR